MYCTGIMRYPYAYNSTILYMKRIAWDRARVYRSLFTSLRSHFARTEFAGNGWTSNLGMRSSSRNIAILSSEANIASLRSNEDTQFVFKTSHLFMLISYELN